MSFKSVLRFQDSVSTQEAAQLSWKFLLEAQDAEMLSIMWLSNVALGFFWGASLAFPSMPLLFPHSKVKSCPSSTMFISHTVLTGSGIEKKCQSQKAKKPFQTRSHFRYTDQTVIVPKQHRPHTDFRLLEF